jgi:23S rRNA pseudouridine2457 synthase
MRYLVFYKPFRVLSQFSPEGEKITLASYFQGLSKDIYPVGRLDYDSEGLLLLTDDKALTNRLLNPAFGHVRTYYVQVEGVPDTEALAQLRAGVWINAGGKKFKTKPAEVTLMDAPEVPERNPPIRFRKNVPDSWIRLTLTEGKNRQVRHMTAAVGHPTLRLIRHSIGQLSIDGIMPGTYREYDQSIRELLFKR